MSRMGRKVPGNFGRSASPGKADIAEATIEVNSGPEADLLRLWRSRVHQHKCYAASLPSTIDPGMVSGLLDDCVASLEMYH
jgi:hypothetical protein